VRLTAEGEILLRHIEPAVSLIRRGEARLLDSASTGGQLRIGASDTICRYFLVPYIERFHQAFPGVHIKVINATSIQCTELLRNGQADFIVVNHPNAYLNHLWSIRSIKQFQDVFVANQSFAHLKNKRLSLAELSEYPLLMLNKKSTTSEFLHSIFQQHALELVPEAELSSNDLLIDLARIGLGIAFVPDYCLPGQPDTLFIVKTRETLPARELAVVYNRKLPVSPAVNEFLNYFKPLQNS
jgi:DNA-binding transcriptional LysR family regulator